MQDKIVTLVLQQAAQAEGSTQALATRLNAPEPTLIRWMTGRAQTPLRAFLAVIDFLMRAELKGAEPAPPAADAAPETLTFPLGPLLGRCPRCDSTEFRLLGGGGLRLTSALACSACGAEIVHGKLLAQLARDAVQHSRAVAVRTQRAVSTSRVRLESGQPRLDASARRTRPAVEDPE